MKNENWIPLGVLDEDYDTTKTEDTVFEQERDIDIIYVGAPYIQKLELLAKVKKAVGRNCRLYGRFRLPWNIYYNLRYRWPGWMRTISFPERTRLHQRAKIGRNDGQYVKNHPLGQIAGGAEGLDHFQAFNNLSSLLGRGGFAHFR